jgi:DNA-binding SARP family transcriptional activator
MLGGLAIEYAAGHDPESSCAPENDSRQLSGAAVQQRLLAVLALLAMAGDDGRSRDELLLHVWPDSTPARARNVLKQTL